MKGAARRLSRLSRLAKKTRVAPEPLDDRVQRPADDREHRGAVVALRHDGRAGWVRDQPGGVVEHHQPAYAVHAVEHGGAFNRSERGARRRAKRQARARRASLPRQNLRPERLVPLASQDPGLHGGERVEGRPAGRAGRAVSRVSATVLRSGWSSAVRVVSLRIVRDVAVAVETANDGGDLVQRHRASSRQNRHGFPLDLEHPRLLGEREHCRAPRRAGEQGFGVDHVPATELFHARAVRRLAAGVGVGVEIDELGRVARARGRLLLQRLELPFENNERRRGGVPLHAERLALARRAHAARAERDQRHRLARREPAERRRAREFPR